MTTKILVPVDFGSTATVAIRAASRMAVGLQKPLIVLYADSFVPPVAYADIPVAWHAENIEELKAAAQQNLSRFVAEHVEPRVDVETRIAADTPIHAILSIASSEQLEMIVMGTHGRSGWKRALLGSIAESVLHEADVPVMTIRHSDSEPSAARHKIDRILCPINYSDVAKAALAKAVTLGDAFDAEIYVVHVVESSTGEVHEGEAAELREWIPSEFRHRCCYEELVVHGHAAERVIDLSKQIDADVIVIGAQHKRFVDSTVIGTTTDRIVRHAPCPVLTVIRPSGSIDESPGP